MKEYSITDYSKGFDRKIVLRVNHSKMEALEFWNYGMEHVHNRIIYNNNGPSIMWLNIQTRKLDYSFTDKNGKLIDLKGHYRNGNDKIPLDTFMNICKWNTISTEKIFNFYKIHRDSFKHKMNKEEYNINLRCDTSEMV